jgi:hypothetical protein
MNKMGIVDTRRFAATEALVPHGINSPAPRSISSVSARGISIVTDPCDVEHDVSIFDDTDVAQALSKQLDQQSVISVFRRAERQKTYAERCLLRANVARPSSRRNEPSDKFPPSHLLRS